MDHRSFWRKAPVPNQKTRTFGREVQICCGDGIYRCIYIYGVFVVFLNLIYLHLLRIALCNTNCYIVFKTKLIARMDVMQGYRLVRFEMQNSGLFSSFKRLKMNLMVLKWKPLLNYTLLRRSISFSCKTGWKVLCKTIQYITHTLEGHRCITYCA